MATISTIFTAKFTHCTANAPKHYIQKCKAEVGRERQAVVHSCQLLTHVSPAVLSKLAKDITWESIPANKRELYIFILILY